MIKVIRGVMLSTSFSFLVACGSDNIPPSSSIANGIYTGAWTETDLSTGDLTALVLNGEVQSFSNDDIMMEIDLNVAGDVVTGRGYYNNGGDTGMVTVSGSETNNVLTLTVERSDGITRGAVLSRSVASDAGSDLALLAGNYSTLDQSTDIVFDDSGLLTGTDNTGCTYSGHAETPDMTNAVYKAYISVSGCGLNGSYEGLGVLATQPRKSFFFQASNGPFIFSNTLFE